MQMPNKANALGLPKASPLCSTTFGSRWFAALCLKIVAAIIVFWLIVRPFINA
jgi:hypothetical protein